MSRIGHGKESKRTESRVQDRHHQCRRAWFQLASSSLGDVNGDKSINMTDATLLVNHILGNQDEHFIIANADVNSDESVTVTDVTSLVNLILNNSNIDIQNVVIKGADDLTFSGGGSRPARVSRK